MASNVGFVDSAVGAITAPVMTQAPATPAEPVTSATTQPATPSSTLLQSPRMVLDPTAGFITQYLSANGSQVVSQTPSAITVAYLRQGLTSDGSPRSSSVTATA